MLSSKTSSAALLLGATLLAAAAFAQGTGRWTIATPMPSARTEVAAAELGGQNVRRIRNKKGLTQEELAEISGFSQQYISGLEQGRRNPTVVTLFHLAQALGASHVELVAPDSKAVDEIAKIAKRKSRR